LEHLPIEARRRLYHSLDQVLVIFSVRRFYEEENPVLQHVGVGICRELIIIIFILNILLRESGVAQSV